MIAAMDSFGGAASTAPPMPWSDAIGGIVLAALLVVLCVALVVAGVGSRSRRRF